MVREVDKVKILSSKRLPRAGRLRSMKHWQFSEHASASFGKTPPYHREIEGKNHLMVSPPSQNWVSELAFILSGWKIAAINIWVPLVTKLPGILRRNCVNQAITG